MKTIKFLQKRIAFFLGLIVFLSDASGVVAFDSSAVPQGIMADDILRPDSVSDDEGNDDENDEGNDDDGESVSDNDDGESVSDNDGGDDDEESVSDNEGEEEEPIHEIVPDALYDYIDEKWDTYYKTVNNPDYISSYNALNMSRTSSEKAVNELSPRSDASVSDSAYPYAHDESWLEYFNDNYPFVRNQGEYATSWAHTAIGLSEFYLVSHGIEDKSVDLSELQLAYWAYTNGTVSPAVCSSGDSVEFVSTVDKSNILMNGGNLLFAAQELYQRGIAREAAAPYSMADAVSENGLDTATEKTAAYYLKNSMYISISDNMEQVKGAILANGAVGVAMESDGTHYSVSRNSYYCASGSPEHCVMLVGWDDDFPAEDFDDGEGNRPSVSGAWLVRNSESDVNAASFGAYFWLSYEDASLSGAWVYCVSTDKYDTRYSYDSQIHGMAGYYKGRGGIYRFANVFTVGGNGGTAREQLEAVGFEVPQVKDGGERYTIKIYTDLEGEDPSTGRLVSSATTQGTLYYAGNYTVSLNNAVRLVRGKKYAVEILFAGKGSTIAIESVKGISYGTDGDFGAAAVSVGAEDGQSFYNSGSGNDWGKGMWDAGSGLGNFVIRAFTNDLPDDYAVAGMSIDDPTPEINGSGEVVKLTALIWDDEGAPFETETGVSWSSNKPEVVTVSEDGTLIPHSDGIAVVTARYLDYSAYAKVTLKNIPPRGSIELNVISGEVPIRTLKDGELVLSAKLSVDGVPEDPDGSFSWSVSDDEVLLLSTSDNGARASVKARENGNALISVSCKDSLGELIYGQMSVNVDLIKTGAVTMALNGLSVSTNVITVSHEDLLSFSCEDENATIYYSLDGGRPATVYEEPFHLSDDYAGERILLRAFAVLEDMYDAGKEMSLYINVKKDGIYEGSALDMQPVDLNTDTLYMVKGQRINLGEGKWQSESGEASVNKKGVLTAKKAGKTRVYIKDHEEESYDVTVIAPALSPKSLTLAVGDSSCFKLVSDIDMGSNYNDVLWYSSNPEVATVENGNIKAHSRGSVVISAFICGVQLKGKVTVKDVINPGKLRSGDSISINAMQSFMLNIDGMKTKNLEWVISSPGENGLQKIWDDKERLLYYQNRQVRITPGGKLTAIGSGTTFLRAVDKNDPDKVFELTVNVRKPQTREIFIASGATKSLSPYMVNKKTAKWELADGGGIVSLNEAKGSIRALTEGVCTIRCYYNPLNVDEPTEGFCYETHVYVYEARFITDELMSLSKKQYKIVLNAGTDMYEPALEGMNYERPFFRSSKPAVAFVDEYGRIYARAAGKAVISTKIHGKTIKLTVIVTP